jgi:hypothetical protein
MLLVVVALLLVVGVVAGATRLVARATAARVVAPPRLAHDVVVQQVRTVARLVTSEVMVRDVVTYRQTSYGSTKQALVVATGRVLAGIDLGDSTRAPDVRIDHEARRIAVRLPPPSVLGLEITGMRTYDERAGLWNPFRPADRDAIYQAVRAQLTRTAGEMGLAEHAGRGARELLATLLTRDGYTVDVTFASPAVLTPAR